MEARQNAPFTAFGTDAPDTSIFMSLVASLDAGPSTASSNSPANVQATNTAAPQSVNTAVVTSSMNQSNPTASSRASSTVSDSATSPASSVSASNTIAVTTLPSATNAPLNSSGTLSSPGNCNSISCSPKLQAAVAVPVVVGFVIVIGLAIFLARRKRRSADSIMRDETQSEKSWTRHLRIFPLDNNHMGVGRFSSSNSMRSGQSGQRFMGSTGHRDNTSMRSIEDAAPPYRDALNHVQHPNMTQTGAGLAAVGLAAPTVQRSASRTSAPPPYGHAQVQPPTGATTATPEIRNPFDDSTPESPIEGASPFRDPSEDGRSARSRPTMSRNSSMRTGQQQDDNSTWYDSDAGSIREAQVGRHLSVISAGGRTINVRNSSQSPPASDQASS